VQCKVIIEYAQKLQEKLGSIMKDRYIVFFISKTKKKMTKYIEEKLNEYEIKDVVPSYGNILRALYENNGKLNMKEIGQLVGKDKSTVTVLVNKLIRLGYIRKDECKEDRRISYITLSSKGKDLQNKFEKISADLSSTAYQGFTEDEKETFLRLLKKLNNNFGTSK